MPAGYQCLPFPLGTITFTAGQTGRLKLRDLPLFQLGRIAHLAGLTIRTRLTPTFTTAPTRAGHNAAIAKVDFFDGRQTRTLLSGNALRMFEQLEHGYQINAEAVATTSTNPRYTTRYLSMGPPRFIGNPTDFAICVANLQNGELRITNGQLTDISADTTACTGEHEVTAHLVLADNPIIPPFYERQEYAIDNDEPITGKGLYAFLGLCDSSAYGAIGAGDFGAINVFTGSGQVVQGVNAPELTRCFNNEMASGQIGSVMGEPINATYDVNAREVNLTTPTAIQARVADLQPVLWCPPDARITKIAAKVDSALRIKTGGSQTSGTIALVGRFLEQDGQMAAQLANEAAQKLGINRRGVVQLKLLSKAQSYNGPLGSYLPWVAKAA